MSTSDAPRPALLGRLFGLELLDDRYPALHGARVLAILAVIQLHVTGQPIPLNARVAGRTFPPLLEQVVGRALAKRPEDRYASAAEFASAMQHVLSGAAELPVHLQGALSTEAPTAQFTPNEAAAVRQQVQAIAVAKGQPGGRRGDAPPAAGAADGARPAAASAGRKLDRKEAPGTSLGLLVGVALAFLLIGVGLAVVLMKLVK